jgi:hypothetical protein
VTLATDGTLTNERVLTAGTGISVTDAGAGSTVTVATSAILPTIVDAKGDLIAGTADNTVARVPASTTDGQVLTVDTAQATGLTWATPASTGAPVGAQYVTLATDGTLTSERVLTAGTAITITDGGAGSTVTVAASASGINALAQTVETKTGAYTIQAADAGKVIRMNATANFTVDSTTGFSVGQKVDVIRIAAGACNVTQGSGATVNGTPGLVLRAQYSAASILCVASNTYYVIGDLSA